MDATGPTFTAIFDRAEDGASTVTLAEEPNVHGFGNSMVEARAYIREAIVTLFGPFEAAPPGFDLVEEVRLPEAIPVDGAFGPGAASPGPGPAGCRPG